MKFWATTALICFGIVAAFSVVSWAWANTAGPTQPGVSVVYLNGGGQLFVRGCRVTASRPPPLGEGDEEDGEAWWECEPDDRAHGLLVVRGKSVDAVMFSTGGN